MRARWPLKQTMQIRWSADTWRPAIKVGSAQAERPAAVRLLRPRAIVDTQNDVQDAAMWI